MYTYTDIAAACFVNRWLVKKERTFRIIATTNSNYIWYYETLYIDMFEFIFCICITISEVFVGSFTLNVLKLCCHERTLYGWQIDYTNNLQFLINYTNYNVYLGMVLSNIKHLPYIWGVSGTQNLQIWGEYVKILVIFGDIKRLKIANNSRKYFCVLYFWRCEIIKKAKIRSWRK